MSAAPTIGPVRRFGPYTLVKKLATGGMAEIWLARQRGLAGFNRFVVIKKILAHLAEQKTFREMFLDEARTCAVLSHPNIVQVYDLGKVEESYFIAMEFIAGENLAAIAWRGMKRSKPFPPFYAARVIADACKALHYAHHLKGTDGLPLQIVHRDISPQNVLVTYEGEVKVVDFGIAKAASKNEQTKTGMLKGKFSYMSPEQCLGSSVDMRSDIFALGILLYELCTGKRLFKHESELMILEMITKRSVVAPSQVAPAISAGLEDIIMKALEKDPRRRFQTSQEMQFALEEYLRDEGHQATNADIAAYMRGLFGDKIEEKRRLREIASREDFEAMYGAEEVDNSAANRRVMVHGLGPNQLRAQVGTAPGQMVQENHLHRTNSHQALPAGAYPPMGSQPSPYPGTPSYLPPEMLPPDNGGWVAPLVIAGALVVIMIASFILFQQVQQAPEAAYAGTLTPAPTAPVAPTSGRTGKLTLKSNPKGAVIYLDGQPMQIREGELARTPSDLSVLQFGQRYHIRLVKEGYEPFETVVVLSEDQAEIKTLNPTLTALPGWIDGRSAGPRSRATCGSISTVKDVGQGPRIRLQRAGSPVGSGFKAELPGKVCKADPADADGAPKPVRIHPDHLQPNAKRSPTAADPNRRRPASRAKQPPPVASNRAHVSATPDLPMGKVTISTVPHATIYWKGRPIGESPLSGYKLPFGLHRTHRQTRRKARPDCKRFEVDGGSEHGAGLQERISEIG